MAAPQATRKIWSGGKHLERILSFVNRCVIDIALKSFPVLLYLTRFITSLYCFIVICFILFIDYPSSLFCMFIDFFYIIFTHLNIELPHPPVCQNLLIFMLLFLLVIIDVILTDSVKVHIFVDISLSHDVADVDP